MQQATGAYTGNGTSQAITGLGFAPDFVIVRGRTDGDISQCTVARTKDMTSTYGLGRQTIPPWYANAVTSLDADGFTVGTEDKVNKSGWLYYWVAFRNSGAGDFVIGKYTGDGNDNRDIAVVGMTQPEFLFLMGNGQCAIYHHKDHPGTDAASPFDDVARPNYVQKFNADGFQVGSSDWANELGTVFYYALFKSSSNVKVGSFTGDGADDRSIAVGFRPDYVIVGQDGAWAMQRMSSSPVGDTSWVAASYGFLHDACRADNIQALEANGFQVGTNAKVNKNGEVMMFLATRSVADTLGGAITAVLCAIR